jgi:hypothetical protein
MKGGRMKLVIVESPYWSEDPLVRERNLRYARVAMADCFARGEAPFASHLIYPQIFPDDDETRAPGARERGITAGLEWARRADETVVYLDLGRSRGMNYGINAAIDANRPVRFRELGRNWDK